MELSFKSSFIFDIILLCNHYPRWRKLAACAQFKIHNLPIPLALFKALYRLEKLFSLWCIKKNSRAILLYFTDCKAIEILTTHLIHYRMVYDIIQTVIHAPLVFLPIDISPLSVFGYLVAHTPQTVSAGFVFYTTCRLSVDF